MQFLFTLVPLMLVVFGIVGVISPRTAWYLQEGWKFKNVEPSNASLALHRIGGLFSIAGGIGFLFFAQRFF